RPGADRRGPRRRLLAGCAGLLRRAPDGHQRDRSEEHTSELQSRENLVCRLLLEKKNKPLYTLLPNFSSSSPIAIYPIVGRTCTSSLRRSPSRFTSPASTPYYIRSTRHTFFSARRLPP